MAILCKQMRLLKERCVLLCLVPGSVILFMVEATNVFGQRSFENMVHNSLHSFAKPSLIDGTHG